MQTLSGGYRNSFDNYQLGSPLVSIVTVVFNSVLFIEKTIQSIVEQNYKNIEYIVIDGGSTDGTIDILKKYNDKIAYWISEKDKGLYDAMNKGLRTAKGDYVWFINSGDQIYDKEVLAKIMDSKIRCKVYYGETMMIDTNGDEIGMRRLKTPEQLTWKSFLDGMLVSHQSIIVSKDITCEYNISYRFSADFDWVIYCLKKASPIIKSSHENICNTKIILSRFLDGGRTKKTIIPGLKERFRIMTKYYGLWVVLFNHFKIGIKFLWYVRKNKRF